MLFISGMLLCLVQASNLMEKIMPLNRQGRRLPFLVGVHLVVRGYHGVFVSRRATENGCEIAPDAGAIVGLE